MKPICLALIAALSLTACASHGPRHDDGFSQMRLDEAHFQVSFQGRDMSSRSKVETYLLYRTAELTLKSGFDWFEMSKTPDPGMAAQSPQFAAGYAIAGWRPAWTFYRKPGFTVVKAPTVGPYDATHIDSYLTSAVIRVGRGERPDDARGAFDARQVVKVLAAQEQRPG